MEQMIVDLQYGRVSEQRLKELTHALEPEIKKVHETVQQGSYETDYAFVNLPADKQMMQQVMQVVQEKKRLHPCMLIVVGIGGSNLGAMAVQQAVFGRVYNDLDPLMQIYYADTVDTDYVHSILLLAEQALKQGKQIIVNVVSKSGKTTETIANFELFLQLLKQYRPNDYADSIVVTTDKDSPLWQLAQQAPWNVLEVPKQVGGRYSVFSPVGLFPLAMIDINIDELMHGAQQMMKRCIDTERSNPAAFSAAWLYALLEQDYNICNLFLFSNELRGLGKWWRQLMGESLGKASKQDGTRNQQALVPIMSLGTTDLHSMGQLYLAAVAPIATTFVVIDQDRFELTIPDYKLYFDQLVANMQRKSLSSIMKAIVHGVQKAYQKRELPFTTITLPEKSAFYLGQLLQYKMLEVVYLASLIGVNAFDQPNVELYKEETREILKHG